MLQLVVVFIGLIASAGACSPLPYRTHPQQEYCDAKIVVKVEVTSFKGDDFIGDNEYGIIIRHVYKGKKQIDTLGNKETLFTEGRFSSCGAVVLDEGQQYIFEVYVTDEGWLRLSLFGIYIKLTDSEKETAFKKRIDVYDCSCKILPTYYHQPMPIIAPTANNDTCTPSSPCSTDDFCVKDQGRCVWRCE